MTRPTRASLPPVLRAVVARRNRGAVGFLVADTGDRDHAGRARRRRARMAHWSRSSIPPRRPSPIPAASNSSSPKAAASSPLAAPKAGRSDYVARVALHRDQIRAETNQLDWLFSTHTTEPLRRRTAAVPACRHDGEQKCRRTHRDRQSGAQRMIAGLPLFLRRTAAAAGPGQPAGAVVAAAGDAAAAAAHRVSADAAVVRHRAQGRDAVADAMVADRCCGSPLPRWSYSPPPARSGIRQTGVAGSRKRRWSS